MICLGGKVSYYHRHDASQAGRFLGRDHHDHCHHHYTGIIWVGVWVSIFFHFTELQLLRITLIPGYQTESLRRTDTNLLFFWFLFCVYRYLVSGHQARR